MASFFNSKIKNCLSKYTILAAFFWPTFWIFSSKTSWYYWDLSTSDEIISWSIYNTLMVFIFWINSKISNQNTLPTWFFLAIFWFFRWKESWEYGNLSTFFQSNPYTNYNTIWSLILEKINGLLNQITLHSWFLLDIFEYFTAKITWEQRDLIRIFQKW